MFHYNQHDSFLVDLQEKVVLWSLFIPKNYYTEIGRAHV